VAFPTIHGVSHTHVTANATSTAAALPDGSNVVGRLVIVCATKDGTGAFTWPSGWTQIAASNDGSSASRTEVRYRIIDGTEGFDGTGDTITLTHASEETACSAITYSSWHGTTPPEAATATGTTGNANPPSLNPAGWGTEDTSWIAYCGLDASVTVTGWPTSYSDNQHGDNTGGTGGCSHGFATRGLNAASDDPGTFTNGSESWMAVTIAVRPAPPTTTASGGVATEAFSAVGSTFADSDTLTGGVATEAFSAVGSTFADSDTLTGGVATAAYSAFGATPALDATVLGGVATAAYSAVGSTFADSDTLTGGVATEAFSAVGAAVSASSSATGAQPTVAYSAVGSTFALDATVLGGVGTVVYDAVGSTTSVDEGGAQPPPTAIPALLLPDPSPLEDRLRLDEEEALLALLLSVV
jgi:hypothetical protein